MKELIIKFIKKIRAFVVRSVNLKRFYFLATRSTNPISRKFGFDRGTPIDRYYIEKFLEQNKHHIKGRCMEVVDNQYTKKFGKNKVTKSDIIDNNPKNKQATIYSDLRKMEKIKSNNFDCLIITHTFGMIDDYDRAIKECYRVLRPDGTLLVTVSSFSPTYDIEHNFWRFTTASAKLAFGKYFKNIKVKSFGNVLSGQCFWVGLAMEELTKKELNYNDPHFPCIVSIKAIKENKQ